MAEKDGKKGEEKFEFTPEGEVLGYISLDQARVLAMEHAKDHSDFYSPSYSALNLVWDVIDAKERDDHYDVRLSFRPSGRFSGVPGIDQFIIDKNGDIRIRR